MKVILILLVIVIIVVCVFRVKCAKHYNPRVNRKIICGNTENHVVGRKNKFRILRKDYIFYVVDGRIIGFKKLGKPRSRIVYYKEGE